MACRTLPITWLSRVIQQLQNAKTATRVHWMVMPVLEELLTSIPYGWWVYDLSQDYAHMLWRCQLVGKVSGKTECVYQEEFDTPSEAVQAAVAKLHERFGLEA